MSFDVLVGAAVSLGGAILGYVAKPFVDRMTARAQWQRSAVVDLVNCLAAFDATSHALLRARMTGSREALDLAKADFAPAVALLETRMALVLDDEIGEKADAYRLVGVRLSVGDSPEFVASAGEVLRTTREALLSRVKAVLRRLG